jgi:2-polyprenyl-6-methoxyphenol hydroxylase-like FAD-dependent oxidoreductase
VEEHDVKIMCVGGGPAGLYFSLLMKLCEPEHAVTVLERNRADPAHGWGVTLGRDVIDRLRDNDGTSARAVEQAGRRWTQQVVSVKGERIAQGGYDVYNIARRDLVSILADRAREVGVHVSYGHEVTDANELRPSDLIVIADGARSRLRSAVGEFDTHVRFGSDKYIWLGSSAPFEAFNYIFKPTDHGWIWAYGYQFDTQTSAVIVECSAKTWTSLGFASMPTDDGVGMLTHLFADHLNGHPLVARLPDGTTATWLNFPTVTNQRWHSRNAVLLGDSAHTAHYSLGQGTKMALEDAIVLADSLAQNADLEAALTKYEAQRKEELARPLSEALCSAEWFERLPRYTALNPHQFASLLESRWSPLVQVLPLWVSYQLQQAAGRFPVLNDIRSRIGPAVKARYARPKPVRGGSGQVRQSA